MEQRLWRILQLFGGAALFLYSMDTLTDALQQAAGDTLRQALRLTAHPLAGVLTGGGGHGGGAEQLGGHGAGAGPCGAGLLTLQRAVPVVFEPTSAPRSPRNCWPSGWKDARYLLLVAGLLLWFAGRGRLARSRAGAVCVRPAV